MDHRRPIAARKLGVMARATDALVRARVSPDAISLAGMVAGMGAGVAIAATAEAAPITARLLWLLGALLVQVRLLANLLDGMVAVRSGTASLAGELFNEVPDRVSDTAVLAGLGWASGSLALGLAAALAAMATAYIRCLGRALCGASDFRGPMAKQQRMAVVTAVAAWCAVAPAEWGAPVPELALWLMGALAAATALRRLLGIAAALRR